MPAPVYTLPTAVRLEFARGSEANSFETNPGFTSQVQAQWARSFKFFDNGHRDGLIVAWGQQAGTLVAADIMLGADYAHEAGDDSAKPSGETGQLWLPGDLTPLDGTDLDTVDVSLYFHAEGAGGTPMLTFPCVPRIEQVQVEALGRGLTAASVAWRWEILDDTPPTVGA